MNSCVIKAALGCGILMVASSASAWTLKNYNSGLCLAAAGGANSPGTPIIQWGCDQTISQSWNMSLPSNPIWPSDPTRITGQPRVGWSNGTWYIQEMCIGVAGASKDQNAPLVLWDCNGSSDQQWKLAQIAGYSMPGADKCYNIVNVNSGRLMTIGMSSTQPGARVIQYAVYAPPTRDAYWCLVNSDPPPVIP